MFVTYVLLYVDGAVTTETRDKAPILRRRIDYCLLFKITYETNTTSGPLSRKLDSPMGAYS